jgi:OFA family oxalate/formate antiporter-like MFS transporter
MVLAPIAASLVESYGVLFAFNILGIVYLFAISISAIFVQMPPTGYMPSGWTPPAVAASTSIVTGYDKNWKEMLSDPLFYVFWALYAIGCVSGLMIIGHASPIGQEMLKLSAKTAALTLSFLAMGNTAGRIFWGWVSDKVGRYHALMSMYLLAGITMSLIGFVSTVEAFVLALMLVGLCFGGFLGIFPSITADMFGAKNLGMNYGIMFTAYGLAAYVGPRLASTIKESNNGDYTQAFVLSASLSLLGIAMTYAASYRRKRLLAQR